MYYVHGIEESILLKLKYFPNWFMNLMQYLSLLKNPSRHFLKKIYMLILIFACKCKESGIAKIIIQKKNKIWGFILQLTFGINAGFVLGVLVEF